MLTTLTSKGQLTVPISIRKKLHLKHGDKIDIFITANGHIECIPVKQKIASLKGILPKPDKAVSLGKLKKAYR